MEPQVVKTQGISAASSRIRTSNNNINSAFDTLRSRMLQLENWRGAAGTVAQTTMHQLFNGNNSRSAVLQNYANMLEQQINPGYVATEATNRSLADNFK